MWKVFDAQSWSALLSTLSRTKQTADQNASAVSGLGEDLAGLAETANAEIQSIKDTKQDKRNAVAVTLPASGWSSDSTVEYPYYYDLAVSGVTAKDRAEVTVAVPGLPAAEACGLCSTNETMAGKIRFRAKKAPSAAIAAEYWIEKGR